MSATAPAWKPQIDRTEPPRDDGFWQKPIVTGTLRALNIVAGIVVAAVAFVVVGAYGSLLNCVGEETHGLCVSYAGLVPVLEWPIFVIAVLAPFAGGIAAFVRRNPVWLALGVGVAFVMFGLMIAVSSGQTPFDWG